jgi:hypothetical protein
MNLAGSITGEQDVRSPFKSTKSQVCQLLVCPQICHLSVEHLPGSRYSHVKNNEFSVTYGTLVSILVFKNVIQSGQLQ